MMMMMMMMMMSTEVVNESARAQATGQTKDLET